MKPIRNKIGEGLKVVLDRFLLSFRLFGTCRGAGQLTSSDARRVEQHEDCARLENCVT